MVFIQHLCAVCHRRAGIHVNGNHCIRNRICTLRPAAVCGVGIAVSCHINLNAAAVQIICNLLHNGKGEVFLLQSVAACAGVTAAVARIQQKHLTVYILRILYGNDISFLLLRNAVAADTTLMKADGCLAAACRNLNTLDYAVINIISAAAEGFGIIPGQYHIGIAIQIMIIDFHVACLNGILFLQIQLICACVIAHVFHTGAKNL